MFVINKLLITKLKKILSYDVHGYSWSVNLTCPTVTKTLYWLYLQKLWRKFWNCWLKMRYQSWQLTSRRKIWFILWMTIFGPKTNRKYFRATFRTPALIFRPLNRTFLLLLGGFGVSKGFKCVQNITEY